jgi:signal peptidase I
MSDVSLSKSKKSGTRKGGRENVASEIAKILKELITTFALVLLFITFVMQTFVIPTGSMADTLKGAHFRLCCPQCGYRYDYGFVPEIYGLPKNAVPRGRVKPPRNSCPSCGHCQSARVAMPITKGDRILVLKCIYQFFEPKRWDVIVFKNPADPSESLIKRLAGRPEETVELIDGDVYINGEISRKPPKVQDELWMPVYDNDYRPARPREDLFSGPVWEQPFRNVGGSRWSVDKDNPTIFRLQSPPDRVHSLIYDTSIGNDFRATYAYNDVRGYNHMPYCSDVMVRFCGVSTIRQGLIGIELTKYQKRYRAWVGFAGEMAIAEVTNGGESILSFRAIGAPAVNKPFLIRFANVDHQLAFEFGSERLAYDLGRGSDDVGPRKTDIEPQVKIFGSGRLKLSHVAVFRDIHYTASLSNYNRAGTATEGNPLKLGKDEFFALGDNSPVSLDGRWWTQEGKGNNSLTYRQGIIPREYLVGKAFVVIWPGAFRPYPGFPFSIIPDVGGIRFIYGGSSREPGGIYHSH